MLFFHSVGHLFKKSWRGSTSCIFTRKTSNNLNRFFCCCNNYKSCGTGNISKIRFGGKRIIIVLVVKSPHDKNTICTTKNEFLDFCITLESTYPFWWIGRGIFPFNFYLRGARFSTFAVGHGSDPQEKLMHMILQIVTLYIIIIFHTPKWI